MKVVVVESPAKAKTINRYLGDDYRVIASVGHIRDLPSKDGSVLPEEDFAMSWQIPPRSTEPINTIRSALRGAETLILATDPDREGEAISWHVLEVMKDKKAVAGMPVQRVVFNEITKSAILEAMQHPRAINTELVEAYLARRALDYLVGFGISPVLWRKLPGARSAGRVQSVALRLICEREAEIEAFIAEEYWDINALLSKADGSRFPARLTQLDGEKLKKFSLSNQSQAETAATAVREASLKVGHIETKRTRRNPNPPFTTSTLQQEASRKLGFSASRTMRVAQRLYEGINIGSETTGLITYMRTDGVQLGNEAIASIRNTISQQKGERYLPSTPRIYKTKAANAQEAHEAIRPTDMQRLPQDMARFLDDDQRRLYDLIWKRTIASQMASAELDKTAADIISSEGKVVLRANGSVIVFDGFLSVYREDRDETATAQAAEDEDSRLLPVLEKGEAITTLEVTPEQHFTQPPPRFTDASLVKTLEELGIGRPSTYASIIQVLQDRSYVIKERGRFVPEDRGRITSAFLQTFFDRYVEYGFTAELESDLDRISDGKLEWKLLLQRFWQDFKNTIDKTADLSRADVLAPIDAMLATHFFPSKEGGEPVRKCSHCGSGMLGLQLGRHGAFIGCSNYPECSYTRQIGETEDEASQTSMPNGDIMLGNDPQTGLPILLRKGPYGIYAQRGDATTKKPARSSLPKDMIPTEVTLEQAIRLLQLPREVGPHPETGQMISTGIGRYGPYILYGGAYVSLPADDSVITIGLNHAVELIAASGKTAGRSLGEHPEGGEIMVKSGRFGPYVEHGKVRATIPKKLDPDALTLEEAVGLIKAKIERGPGRGFGSRKAAAKSSTETRKKTTANTKGKTKPKAKKKAGAKSRTASSSAVAGK